MPSRPILLLLISVTAGIFCDSEFPIRRSQVLSTWQSSYADGETCFHSRNQFNEEFILRNKSFSYRFFHSDGKDKADGGFHWFAVQLNETVLISSVTVKGREDTATDTFNRAVGVEIWTSGSSSQMFSGDHCSSGNMSRQFRESQRNWRLCGVTERKHSNISAGENFTVNCFAHVRHLLLRMNATAASIYMSFADVRLKKAELHPPSSVSVSILNFNSCQNLSDMIVQFTSTVSQPVPEHRCRTESDGTSSSEPLLKYISLNSSDNGSVSLWQLKVTEDSGWRRSISIKCSALQNLTPEVEFHAARHDTARLCSEADLSEPLSLIATASAVVAAVALLAVSIVIAVVRCSGRIRPRDSHADRFKIYSILQVNSQMIPYDVQATIAPSGNSERECIYFTVLPAGAADEAMQHQDSASESTEFIEIMVDGD